MKGKSALTLLLAGIFSCGTCQATGAEVTSESVFNILNSTGAATDKSYLSLNPDKYPNYRLLIHSAKLQNEIKSHYTKDEIQGLLTLTENTRKLTLTEKPWGTFILASTFEDDKTAAETHYDAVWLRDSLWGYMALVSDQGNSVAAKKVLLTLWDYMSTPAQIKQMQDVISNPKRLDGIPVQMNAVHIRFDSNSPVMADVQEEGKPQLWNHKQNDALGLYLDLLIQAINTGTINAEDWQKGDRLKSVALLIAYLDKANFYVMEDS